MLMLQRAAENVNPSECNDPAVLLACALSSDSCPAACTDEARKAQQDKENGVNPYEGVQAGDLNIAVSSSSSTVSIPNDGVIKVAELDVKASENIQLQSVSVTRQGLSQNSNLKVWIEKDGRRITSASSFFGDSKANLTFNNNGYVVNWNETLDLVVSLSGVAQGSELQFKVSDLVSSAKSSSISPDTTWLFRTTNYKATSISFVSVNNSARSYNLASDTSFSFGEFKLQNDSSASMEKDVLIKSITFKVEGSIENLGNMKLLRDGKEVSSKYTVDGKSVTFAVNDQLDSGKSATYKVTAVPTAIENAATDNNGASKWDEYTFKINKDSDVIAEEIWDNATAYRVSVKGTMPIDLGTTTIKWGNITLTRDTTLASTVSADWSYSDVVIAKGTVKVNQAVKFEKAFINAGTVTDTNNSKLNKVLRRAALVIDGKTYQAEISENWLSIDSEIYFSKGDHKLELQVSLANAGTATKFTMGSIDKDTFKDGSYTNGDETQFKSSQVAGTIRVSDVTIQQKKITIKKVGPSEDIKVSQGNTDEKVLLVGEITNSADKNLEVNKFVVEALTWTPAWEVDSTAWITYGDVYVSLNDSSSSVYSVSKTQSAGIDSMTTTIEPGKTVKFEVRIIPSADLKATRWAAAAYCEDSNYDNKADCEDATKGNTTWHDAVPGTADVFKFSVSVEGKLDGNTTSSSALKTAKVTATAGGTETVVGNTTDNKLIVKPGVSVKIASFNYNVKNDSVDLNSLKLKVKNLTASELDDLTIDFGGSVGAPGLTFVGGSDSATEWDLDISFNNVVTLPVANYKVSVYATFNESAIKSDKVTPTNNPKKEITGVKFPNITNVAPLTFGHYVAKAYPILSVKDKNTTSDNARLDISVRKSNDDANTVTLEAIYSGTTNGTNATAKWHVVDGANTTINLNSLDKDTPLVIGSSKAYEWTGAQKNIASIKFMVVDDEGKIATYDLVNAGSDFASLSL